MSSRTSERSTFCSDDSGDDSPISDQETIDLMDEVAKETSLKHVESKKKALKKLKEKHQKKRDWKCVFISENTKKRCSITKALGSKYCTKHKSYVKSKKTKAPLTEMLRDLKKEKKEEELKQKSFIIIRQCKQELEAIKEKNLKDEKDFGDLQLELRLRKLSGNNSSNNNSKNNSNNNSGGTSTPVNREPINQAQINQAPIDLGPAPSTSEFDDIMKDLYSNIGSKTSEPVTTLNKEMIVSNYDGYRSDPLSPIDFVDTSGSEESPADEPKDNNNNNSDDMDES